jgi:hypothetical protein
MRRRMTSIMVLAGLLAVSSGATYAWHLHSCHDSHSHQPVPGRTHCAVCFQLTHGVALPAATVSTVVVVLELKPTSLPEPPTVRSRVDRLLNLSPRAPPA